MRIASGWIAAPAMLAAVMSVSAAPGDSAWIDAQRQQWQVPGVAVAIVRDGEAPQLLASGLCNLEQQRPCSERSQFPIASNTKFFTGLLAAVLAEKQVLRLDAPLAQSWPDLRLSDARAEALTLTDLLTHSSGLGSVDWPYFWDAQLDRDDYLARLRHVPMAAPLREVWHYANANFVLAGAYMERVTGRDWAALLREHVLAPLQMDDAGFGLPVDGTRGYTPAGRPGAVTPAAASTVSALASAGSLVLSARDYARMLAALLGRARSDGASALPRAALDAATRAWVTKEPEPHPLEGPGGYALGLFTARYRGDEIHYHIGRTTGFNSAVVMLPQRGLAVAVLTNVDSTSFPQALALALADRQLGRSGDEVMRVWAPPRDGLAVPGMSPSTAAAVAPSRALSAYAGRYQHPAWGAYRITTLGDGLRIRMAQLDAPLIAMGPDRFWFEALPGWTRMQLVFTSDTDGRINGFSLDDGANPEPMLFVRARAPHTPDKPPRRRASRSPRTR